MANDNKIDFFELFSQHVQAGNTSKANSLLMKELGKLLVTNREDFIYILKFAGVKMPDDTYTIIPDTELVNLFINNVDKNPKLLLGAAYLISHNHKISGFDGDYTSPVYADAASRCMQSYFCGCSASGTSSYDGDSMSNFEGDPDFLGSKSYADASTVGAIGNAIGGIGNAVSSIANARTANSPLAALQSKAAAKNAIIQGAIDAKKQEAINAGKAADTATEAEKSKRTKIIVFGVIGGVLALSVATAIIIKVMKKRRASA